MVLHVQAASTAATAMAALASPARQGDMSIQEAPSCCRVAGDGDVDVRSPQLLHSGGIRLRCVDPVTWSWPHGPRSLAMMMMTPATNIPSLLSRLKRVWGARRRRAGDGKRCCLGEVRCHQPRLCPLAPSQPRPSIIKLQLYEN